MNVPFAMNAEFVDSQYQRWRADAGSVSREWQLFFEGFELGVGGEDKAAGICDQRQVLRQARVGELIDRYRDVGHLLSCLDPLAACPMDHPLLEPAAFELTEDDRDLLFFVPRTLGPGPMRLNELLQALRETYCRSIGIEYLHLQDPGERLWLQERMEPSRNRPSPDSTTQRRILEKLYQATLFEQFLHARYAGQKRFSIEGAEVIVAMLDALFHREAARGCRECILGMAHRGRLNVQTNVLGKLYEAVFCQFEDSYDPDSLAGSGDVKYHTGYLADFETGPNQRLRILMAPNASHLESVDPVVEGIARARQEYLGERGREQVLPILIHGDAAFAGEGIVAETLNLSQLEGYSTGGTVHIVINNQIGFTTLPQDARSTRYSTDVAKMLMVPIFHVHGEDPEAVVHVAGLAADYRREFGKDVVIDVICYRRHGHSEADEPYFTQPQMVERIKNRPQPNRLYAEKLVKAGIVASEELDRLERDFTQRLEAAHERAQHKECVPPFMEFFDNWREYHGTYSHEPVVTGVAREVLVRLAENLHRVPDGFSLHERLGRILERRLETVRNGAKIDWATAEGLAFATLLREGTPIRLSGEDSRRGTFSQRHCVLVDAKSGERYTPLQHLGEKQAPFMVYDSMLAEEAVLGFEYGYAAVSPQALVIWEAQFGDFANNAQVIIDQYLAAGEAKWSRPNGLVLLLPHGFEGQGPEHSSARLERFLQLCAEDNLQVCYPSTPAQYFHLLRRQVRRSFRKPLVMMAPKSLLRHPEAVSTLDDMASGHFQEVLDEPSTIDAPGRVIVCSGKIYYELAAERARRGARAAAIVRLEQFYPFPFDRLKEVVSHWRPAREWYWVQEEPANMGGWSFVRERLQEVAGTTAQYIGRQAAASPAVGYHSLHRREQAAIVDAALGT